MISNVALFSLPLLAAGAHHGHHHHHNHAHVARSQAVEKCPTDMVTVTKTAYVTVTVPSAVSSLAPSSSSVVSVTSSSQAPVAPSTPAQPPTPSKGTQPPAKGPEPENKSGGNTGDKFNPLQAISNTAIVKNSCSYPVYIWSTGHSSCDGTQTQGQLIKSKGIYTEALRQCKDGGVALKISKTQNAAKPMQFEYAIWKDGSNLVSYDISYLDCMKNSNGEKDLNDCAGHDGGIQALGGADNSPAYQCPANEWCDKQAYVVAEFDYKPGAPVGAVDVSKGIAFELCACSG